MKSFVIVVKDNEISELGYQQLVDSYMQYGHYDGIEPHYAVELDKVDGFTSGNTKDFGIRKFLFRQIK